MGACKSRMDLVWVTKTHSQLLQADRSPVNRAPPPSLLLLQLLLSIHFNQVGWSSEAHRLIFAALFARSIGRNTKISCCEIFTWLLTTVGMTALQRHGQLCLVALWTTADVGDGAGLLTPTMMQCKKPVLCCPSKQHRRDKARTHLLNFLSYCSINATPANSSQGNEGGRG